jgi:hypothetical protein
LVLAEQFVSTGLPTGLSKMTIESLDLEVHESIANRRQLLLQEKLAVLN